LAGPGELDKRIQFVVENTEVVRNPKQKMATFGTTRLSYFLVTEPVYEEILFFQYHDKAVISTTVDVC
jgi:hypothetical protein